MLLDFFYKRALLVRRERSVVANTGRGVLSAMADIKLKELREAVAGQEEYFEWRCSVCEENGLTNNATSYCKNCDECLCSSCLKSHSRYNKGHKVLGEKEKVEWGKSELGQDTGIECVEHPGQTVSMYCGQHDDLCCPVCVALKHVDKCKPDMTYIPQFAKGIMTGAEFKAVNNNNNSISLYFTGLVEERTKLQVKLSASREECTRIIEEFYKELVQHLKKLKDDAMREMNKNHDAVEGNIKEDIKICTAVNKELSEMKQQLNPTGSVNESLVFVKMKKGKTSLTNYADFAQNLDAAERLTFEFNPNPSLHDTVKSALKLGVCAGVKQLKSTRTTVTMAQKPYPIKPAAYPPGTSTVNTLGGLSTVVAQPALPGVVNTPVLIMKDKKAKQVGYTMPEFVFSGGTATSTQQSTGFNYGGGQTSFGASTGFGTGTSTGSTSLYGQTVTAQSGGLFGANKTLIGTATTTQSGFGTSTSTGTSLYGQTATTQSGGLFGANKPLLGTATTTHSGFGFGTSTSTGTSLYGQTATTQSGGLFGANKPLLGTATTTQSGFGTSTSTGTSLYGQTATTQSGGLFGANKPLLGTATTTQSGFGFGTSTSTDTSLYGQTATTQSGGLFGANKPLLGTATTQSGFGFGTSLYGLTATTQSGELFGANKPLFGTATTKQSGFGAL